jgi:hypothetical protein
MAMLALASVAEARIETLRWLNADADPSRVTSFRIHYGSAPGANDVSLSAGLPALDAEGAHAYALTVPDDAPLYVAVTALVGSVEGQRSNEVFRPAPGSPPPSAARDVTAEAGVDYLQLDLGAIPTDEETTYMTGGAAAADYDGDGWVDLYVTRLDAPDLLFRNRGDGTFSDATAAAGLAQDLPSNGAAWGDIDNDGDPDLYVTTLGSSATRFHLFVNDGAGVFDEEALRRGAAVDQPGAHYGQSVTFGDFDRDGWLDIHTTEWRPSDLAPGAPSNARLLRNRGAEAPGYFEDVTDAAGVALEGPDGVFALSSRFGDLDGDGWSDLLVVGDGGTSRLFWNNGDGTFSDGTTSAGVGTDENGTGSAVGDVNGDGLLDWFVTGIYAPDDVCADPAAGCGFGSSGNRLFLNAGGRRFLDGTDAVGVRDGGWGSAAALYDLDNDGDLDAAMSNGANVPYLAPPNDAVYARFDPDLLRVWRNDGGVATEVSSDLGMSDSGAGRGLLTFDFDRDGDLDLFVVNNADGPVLYRNDIGTGHRFLRVRTRGRDSNRSGIGAVVRLWRTPDAVPQIREIEAGSHYLGQSELAAHFGLGSGTAPVHRVEVSWPATDRTQVFSGVAPDSEILAIGPAAASPAPDPAPDPAPPAAAQSPAGGGGGGGGACGLLGVEPLIVLALCHRRRRK